MMVLLVIFYMSEMSVHTYALLICSALCFPQFKIAHAFAVIHVASQS